MANDKQEVFTLKCPDCRWDRTDCVHHERPENTFRTGMEWALREVWFVKSDSLEQERMREKIVDRIKLLRAVRPRTLD